MIYGNQRGTRNRGGCARGLQQEVTECVRARSTIKSASRKIPARGHLGGGSVNELSALHPADNERAGCPADTVGKY